MKLKELIEKIGRRNAVILAVVLCLIIVGIVVFAVSQTGGGAGAGGQGGDAQTEADGVEGGSGSGSTDGAGGQATIGQVDGGSGTSAEGYYINEDGVPVYTIDPKKRAAEQASGNGEETAQGITFPYEIPDTGVTVLNVDAYDGQYLEKGLDAELNGCAAMVVKNTGSRPLEFMYITAVCGETAFVFEGSALEPGAMMVMQESSQQSYVSGNFSNIEADVAELESLEMSEKSIKVEEKEDGSLKVTNLTKKDIPTVRVFYKYYMSDENAYVGGITYNAKINDLKAKGNIVITPSHYEAGYSRVVMVRTYDEAQ